MKANLDQSQPLLSSLTDSVGVEFNFGIVLNIPGVYFDDPDYFQYDPAGPVEDCPNCPSGPDEPPVGDRTCKFILSAMGGDCNGRQVGDISGGVEVRYGSAEFSVEVSDQSGAILYTNEGSVSTPRDKPLDERKLSLTRDQAIGLYSVRIYGEFSCYADGSITEFDYTFPRVAVGGSCGGSRQTQYESWEVFYEPDQLFYRTTLALEISYSGVKARASARANVTKSNGSGYWAPASSYFDWHQFSQWREDDYSCAKRARHDRIETVGTWWVSGARNTVNKDNRFWNSGGHWVELTTRGPNGEYEGSGGITLIHGICD